MLRTPRPSTSVSHSADDFAAFFRSKVDKICQATATAPLPVIVERPCVSLSAFSPVTVDEIIKVVSKAPANHCSLARPGPDMAAEMNTTTAGTHAGDDMQCLVK